MHAFQEKAYILGPGFCLDRCGRIVDGNGITLGDQAFEFGNACADIPAVFIQGQPALVEVEFQAGQQQLQRGRHQLAGEGFGDLATTAQAFSQLNLQPGALELVVLDHIVEVADHDQ
ncbi:hypothetical protein D3C75_1010420 [compost metagenome]